MLCPLEINSVNNNDLSNTKDLQEDDLEEPIASRTRNAKKTTKHAEITSKTISNNLLKTLSLITMLSLVTVQIVAANNCKGISGISYNFPQRWNCEEIINELQASFIIDKENNTNPYLMRGNIILDMANGNDENLTKKSPRAIRKQLLMLETPPGETFDPNNISINAELELGAHNQDTVNTIYHRPKDDSLWQEISEQGEELTNQLGKEFDQVIQSNQEELDNVATHWRLITVCMSIVTISLVIISPKFKLTFLRSLFCFSRERNSNHKNVIVFPKESKLAQVLDKENQVSVTRLNTLSYTPEDLPVKPSY
uniref:Uncharacterized protein n=1 Tax=Loa loa TaxID=7209 RepID=A0A1I7VXF1_LOALO